MDRDKPTSRVAIALALCAPVVGGLELLLHLKQTGDVATDEDWKAARAAVEKSAQPSDLVIFAPKWLDPVGRGAMGDAIMTTERAAFPDASRFPRALEVSVRGAHRAELEGWKKTGSERFGRVEVATWENPAHRPVIDDPTDMARIQVSLSSGGACSRERSSPQTAGTYFPPGVPLPGERFNCGSAVVGVTVLPALDYSARRCIFAQPSQGTKIRVRFSGVKLGKVLHGNHGMYAENERDKKGAPVTIELSVGGQHVGRATHRDGDGWSYFEMPTHDLEGRSEDVVAEIATSGNDRQYCFEVTSR